MLIKFGKNLKSLLFFDYIVVLRIRGNNYIVFFLFGLAAGIASLSLSIFLKLTINGLFIPEIASQGLISITSGEIESQAGTNTRSFS